MVDDIRSLAKRRINFELVKQPIPDNSPEIEESQGYDTRTLSKEAEIIQLRLTTKQNQAVIHI